MKVAPSNLIYLLANYHTFLRTLDIFHRLISFLCGLEKLRSIFEILFLFLQGRAR
jgi:hypothetical protein